MVSNSNFKFGFVDNDFLIAKFAFTEGQVSEIVVGRDSKAQIRIEKAEISGLHLQLIFDGSSRLYLVDLGSTNGTFINGTRISPGVQTLISSKDVVSLAQVNGIRLVFNPDFYQSPKVNAELSSKQQFALAD